MLERLTLQRCLLSGDQLVPQTGPSDTLEVMLNPNSFSHGHEIDYNDDGVESSKTQGEIYPEQIFAGYSPETLSFDLTFDGTGAVPTQDGSPPTPVPEMIDKLKTICYTYNGSEHQPNFVKLKWGEAFDNFNGRLKTLKLDYKLFKSTGEPLRATTKLEFRRFRTREEALLDAGQTSPDMTHVIRIREGDTLPLLCETVYKDGGRYLTVARQNGLVNFRALESGALLRFPPIT